MCALKGLDNLEIQCHKLLHLKAKAFINLPEISSFIYKGNSFLTDAILGTVILDGRNMCEDNICLV